MISEEARVAVTQAHGIIGCLAWGFIIPLGAVLIRVIPSKKAWIIHGGVMLLGLSMITASFGMGYDTLTAQMGTISKYAHTIIGTILFSLAWVQPFLGTIHHFVWQKAGQRSYLSAVHIFFGRLFILIGMVNGGVGLMLAGYSTRPENIAYGTLVGIIWVVYILLSLGWEVKREDRRTEERVRSETASAGSSNEASYRNGSVEKEA